MMKKKNLLFSLLFVGVFSQMQAQVPFSCDTNMYLVQGIPAELFRIDTSTNPFGFIKISPTPNPTGGANAVAFNPIDRFIYALRGGPNEEKILIKIDSNGEFFELGTVTGLDITSGYNAGDMDENGNYYVKLGNLSNTKFYKIDIATRTATLIPLSQNFNSIDFAYTITDKLLWTQDTISKRLVSIDPATGQVTFYPYVNAKVGYGAWFGSSTGQIYASNNDGVDFVEFDKTTGEALFISPTQPSTNNDGAHCPTAPITFDLYCRKFPVTDAGFQNPSKHGITSLGRAGAENGNWPMVRQNAWTVLESKTKGFVLNRVPFSDHDNNPSTPDLPVGIPPANFVEGMAVFDTKAQCLKIYNGSVWSCYSTPACP